MALIRIDNLVVQRENTVICRVPELRIDAHEQVGVGGDNGSGKTTLLRVIAGLERRHTGTCEVDAGWRDRVFVAQNPILFRGTVLANVMYGLRVRGLSRRAARTQAAHWLDAFGIGALAMAASSRLSGGERRRTALAQALAFRPALVLLDEPLSDLDEDGRERLTGILKGLHSTTVLMTSPSPLPDGLAGRHISLTRMAATPRPKGVNLDNTGDTGKA